jgi:proteasome lid subunit RPN8/RPN11
MLILACENYPSEVGTSLVGYYSSDGFDAYVEDVTPIPPDSFGNKFSFYRGIRGMMNYFLKLRKTHSDQRYYVGEWHSHPDNIPYPSSDKDDPTLVAISNDKKTDCPECILVIIGGDLFNKPTLNVVVYSRKKGKVQLIPEL